MRSLELVEAAPGDELSKLSDAPFVDSDSELCDSILIMDIILNLIINFYTQFLGFKFVWTHKKIVFNR